MKRPVYRLTGRDTSKCDIITSWGFSQPFPADTLGKTYNCIKSLNILSGRPVECILSPVRYILTIILFSGIVRAYSAENYEFMAEILKDGTLKPIRQNGKLNTIPPGSLLKPFLTIYLAEKEIVRAEKKIFCPGSKKSAFGMRKACWRNPGHGWVNIEKALGESCNFYFYSLSGGIKHGEYFSWLHEKWGFPPDLSGDSYDALIGDSLEKDVPVVVLIMAYHKLFLQSHNPSVVPEIVAHGLLSAGYGTLKGFSQKLRAYPQYRFLAGKTGTSQLAGKTTGTAVVMVKHMPSDRKFIMFAASEKKMGSAVAADNLFSIFRNERKNRKIP